MFRTPRENAISSSEIHIKPSVGRPPTPPNRSNPISSTGFRKVLELQPKLKKNISNPGKMSAHRRLLASKKSVKSNTSILSFFKKVDSPLKDDPIFVSDRSRPLYPSPRPRSTSPDPGMSKETLYKDEESLENLRFNEHPKSVKKRKIQAEITSSKDDIICGVAAPRSESFDLDTQLKSSNSRATTVSKKPRTRRTGPFLSDSDTDNENNPELLQQTSKYSRKLSKDLSLPSCQFSSKDSLAEESTLVNSEFKEMMLCKQEIKYVSSEMSCSKPIQEARSEKSQNIRGVSPLPSNLLKHRSKVCENNANPENPSLRVPTPKTTPNLIDEWGDLDDSNFFEDNLVDGEEFIVRKLLEEQVTFEAEDENGKNEGNFDGKCEKIYSDTSDIACPVCNANLTVISSDLALKHVNACLDGNTVHIQSRITDVKHTPLPAKSKHSLSYEISRRGQTSPFSFEATNSGPVTAFSKLMAGKAEDAAWNSATASEISSKGKPAYQRTCPFYKIIPGFFICVDAFRYGAVQGCVAYFLSHFHSDHYMGLTSSWRHGPIYCSKVTGNLVKQQLRVDPKYVVSLEFEKNYEIPDTQGVTVSMISANHCPGSSLFLFEKNFGKGLSARLHRVLHCGDFRACPAHINHPLLMPDLVDSITGKTKQQKIDVCYLDTTYLNSRYAFPPQKQVIQTCADICLSLQTEGAEGDVALESIKLNRAVSKYFSSAAVKSEGDIIPVSSGGKKAKGRLLIVCGTYSIGKELICLGIARALDCKIFAPARKMRICAALEDQELTSRMTSNPREAQIHLQMLMEIRPETLQEYLNSYKPHFSRIVGFRPSGWTYKPPPSRAIQSATVSQILTSTSWRSSFSVSDLSPQLGSTREASCFGVPYSEHSSFRELALFVCALRIEKIIPTVNISSAASRAKMQAWIDKWQAERRKNGPVKIGEGEGEVKWY